ncbi:hypothetical protein VTH06DRAFT_7382 [Thermothelomyces fergusii]
MRVHGRTSNHLDLLELTPPPPPRFSSNAREPFCSWALLTLPNDVGPYTYIACGRTAVTDQYLAYTTSTEEPPTTTSAPQSTSAIPSSTRADSQRTTTETTAPPPTATRGLHTRPTDTGALPSSDPASPNNNNNSNDDHDNNSNNSGGGGGSNNTAAIIGGVFGCLALVCACAVLVFWMRLRNKTAAGTGVRAEDAPAEGTDAPPPAYKGAAEAAGREVPAELPGRTPAEPVELPAWTGGGGGGGDGGWNRLSRGLR